MLLQPFLPVWGYPRLYKYTACAAFAKTGLCIATRLPFPNVFNLSSRTAKNGYGCMNKQMHEVCAAQLAPVADRPAAALQATRANSIEAHQIGKSAGWLH